MKKRILGITGSRAGPSPAQYLYLLGHINEYDILHHGDCKGVDEEAVKIAHYTGIHCVSHPPSNMKWRAHTQSDEVRAAKPYRDRNMDIVRESDEIIACPRTSDDKGGGTWMTIGIAREIGKPITIVHPDGSVEREVPVG